MGNVIAFPQKPGWEEKVRRKVEAELSDFPESTRAAVIQAVREEALALLTPAIEVKYLFPSGATPEEAQSILDAISSIRAFYEGLFQDALSKIVTLKVENLLLKMR